MIENEFLNRKHRYKYKGLQVEIQYRLKDDNKPELGLYYRAIIYKNGQWHNQWATETKGNLASIIHEDVNPWIDEPHICTSGGEPFRRMKRLHKEQELKKQLMKYKLKVQFKGLVIILIACSGIIWITEN